MTMMDKSKTRVPEWLHFHFITILHCEPQLGGHLHGQEEQVVNVFQGCGERASL